MTWGPVACESIRFFRLKLFSFTRREKQWVKLETWARLGGKQLEHNNTGTRVFRNIALLKFPNPVSKTYWPENGILMF